MKAKTPPTSPKYKVECLEKLYQPDNLKVIEKPPKKDRHLFILITALIVGFLAGFAGNFVFNYILVSYPDFSQEILNINGRQAEVVPKQSSRDNFNFSDIKQNIRPSQVSIFTNKEVSENDLAGVYLPHDLKGYGLILSSEGLIVTTKAAIEDFKANYSVVTFNSTVYEASDFILDPATNLVFFKIDAENLKAAEFSAAETDLSGVEAIVYKNAVNLNHENIFSAEIQGLNDLNLSSSEDLIKSSESIHNYLTISKQLDDSYEGCLLLDEKSKVIAIGTFKNRSEKNSFVPLNNISSILTGILNDETVIRPYLGLHFVDLSQALNISPALSRELESGFLVYGSDEKLPVIKNSPAAKAGLLEGDVITKINGQPVAADLDFSEFIQNSGIGETLTLLINRDNEEISVEVKLASHS